MYDIKLALDVEYIPYYYLIAQSSTIMADTKITECVLDFYWKIHH